jgi:hypothetical protein
MKSHLMILIYPKYSRIIKNWVVLAGLLIGFSVTVTACKKKPAEDPKPDGQALKERFLQNRQDMLQTFTIDASAGGTITGSQGSEIYIPAGALGLNGTPVSGNVEIQLIEIYSRGHMLLDNMPTNGKNANGEIEMLKTAGEFYLNAVQNGNNLEILTFVQFRSKPVDPNDVDNNMQLFRPECNDPADVGCEGAWEEDPNPAGHGIRVGANQMAQPIYIVDLAQFGWTNLDRWYNYNGPQTTLHIDVPDGFDDTNCEVFLSYDGEDGLARMDVYDDQTGMFTEHYGKLPVGQQVHIILIADIDGEIHYTIQGTTITQNHVETMAYPQPTTEADLLAVIDNLP